MLRRQVERKEAITMTRKRDKLQENQQQKKTDRKKAAKKLILRYPRVRLNFSIKRMFEFLAYNGAFGTTPYAGAGLEMYLYCNYRDEFE